MSIFGTIFSYLAAPFVKTVAKRLLPKAVELIPGKTGDIIEEVFDDVWGSAEGKADLKAQRERAKAKVQLKVQSALADIAYAETTQGNWIQRSWRPLSMLLFVMLIVMNALFPIWNTYMGTSIMLNIPDGMWTLLTIGMTTYIGARTIEKLKK